MYMNFTKLFSFTVNVDFITCKMQKLTQSAHGYYVDWIIAYHHARHTALNGCFFFSFPLPSPSSSPFLISLLLHLLLIFPLPFPLSFLLFPPLLHLSSSLLQEWDRERTGAAEVQSPIRVNVNKHKSEM